MKTDFKKEKPLKNGEYFVWTKYRKKVLYWDIFCECWKIPDSVIIPITYRKYNPIMGLTGRDFYKGIQVYDEVIYWFKE